MDALMDKDDRYGAVSRLNHWLGAAAVFAMIAVGLYFSNLPRGDSRDFWFGLHVSLGVLLFVFLFFRISWRLMRGFPPAFAQPLALQRLTAAVHRGMLLAMGVLILTGPFIVWTLARPLEVFDWFTLPSPLPKLRDLHEALETAHVTAAYTLISLVAVHVLGALGHALKGDSAGRRMRG